MRDEIIEDLKVVSKLLKKQLKDVENSLKGTKKIEEFNSLTEKTIKIEHAIHLLSTAVWVLR